MNFQFPWGGSFWLNKETGIAKNVNTEIHKDVHTSHNSAIGSPHQVYTNVHTSTSYVSGLWLTLENGKDKHYEFNQKIIPILEGHKITIVCGANAGAKTDGYTYVYNSTTGDGCALNARYISRAFGFSANEFKSFILPLIILGTFFSALLIIMGTNPLLALIAAAFVAFILSYSINMQQRQRGGRRAQTLIGIIRDYANSDNSD
jgi:hypothetical protein